MKPTIIRNRMMFMAPQHFISKQLGSPLSKELKEKYHRRSLRVVEGDSVKVLRGEFKGIEGKVTQVSTEKRGVAIEGIKREKLKGGSVDIYIHPSNIMITTLNLEDKWRQNRLERQKTKTPKTAQPQEPKEIKPKEIKPKEKPKEQKETPKEKTKETKKETESKAQRPKKETKPNDKPDKKEKQKNTKSKGDK